MTRLPFTRFVLLTVALSSLHALAAESPAAESPAAKSPAAEIERLRRVAELVTARRVIREHDSGKKPASPVELDAARATLRRLEASERAPSAPRIPPGHSSITMADADMKTLAAVCVRHFGGPVAISDRLARRTVTLRFTAPAEAELRTLLRAELLRQGIALVEVPGGKRLEAVTPAEPPK